MLSRKAVKAGERNLKLAASDIAYVESMEGVVLSLRVAKSDPFLNPPLSLADELDLGSWLEGIPRSEVQALDAPADPDVFPQTSYPASSPPYDSEDIPSPVGMDSAMSPVSTGGDSEEFMSEFNTVNFNDLLDPDYSLENLVDDEPMANTDGGQIEELQRQAQGLVEAGSEYSDDESATKSITSVASPPVYNTVTEIAQQPRYNTRGKKLPVVKEEGKKYTVITTAALPDRSTITGPRVVRVANRTSSRQDTRDDACSEADGSEIFVEKSQKNAIQARINRQKKKAYVSGLEKQVTELSTENSKLKANSSKLQKERDSLEEELAYLKNVLANESMLSGLLNNIGNVPNIQLTTSFTVSRKRAASTEHDHDYGKTQKRAKYSAPNSNMGGGICLHVDQENVSLEFCSACAKMATGEGR